MMDGDQTEVEPGEEIEVEAEPVEDETGGEVENEVESEPEDD